MMYDGGATPVWTWRLGEIQALNSTLNDMWGKGRCTLDISLLSRQPESRLAEPSSYIFAKSFNNCALHSHLPHRRLKHCVISPHARSMAALDLTAPVSSFDIDIERAAFECT